MANALKICLMIHVEDGTPWGPGWNSSPDHLSQKLYRLASMMNAKDAGLGLSRTGRLSVQFGRDFLDRNAASDAYPGQATSLKGVLENGGNFWSHGHDATYNGLVTRHNIVLSAFHDERAGSTAFTMSAPFGKSGGPSVENPRDWVSMAQFAGLKYQDGTVMQYHCMVDVASRPYSFDTTQLAQWYYHEPAPGPLGPAVQTMRLRPFFAQVASNWFGQVAAGWDSVAVDSLLIIPHPSKADLTAYADHASYDVKTLTTDDLTAAMTEIWTAFQVWTTHMRSVHGVWYTQLSPDYITDNSIATLGAWVDSVTALLTINGATPFAQWMNMNEIGSIFVNSPFRSVP